MSFNLNKLKDVSREFYKWLKEEEYITYNGPTLGTTSRIKKFDLKLNKWTRRGYPDEGGLAIVVDSWHKGPLHITLKVAGPKSDDWQDGWSSYREETNIQQEAFFDLIWQQGALRNWQDPNNLLDYLKKIVRKFEGEYIDAWVDERRGGDDLADWDL